MYFYLIFHIVQQLYELHLGLYFGYVFLIGYVGFGDFYGFDPFVHDL